MRVVRTTKSIEVMLLHEAQISFHQFETFRVTRCWIMLMLVHATDQERFPIKAELSSGNFDFSETKLWSVYVKLWSVYVAWFCFALEPALEGPPGPLADGHLLPHA